MDCFYSLIDYCGQYLSYNQNENMFNNISKLYINAFINLLPHKTQSTGEGSHGSTNRAI
jgi:hypothetical protein